MYGVWMYISKGRNVYEELLVISICMCIDIYIPYIPLNICYIIKLHFVSP